MDASLVLTYVLILFTIVVGTLLSGVLYRAFIILKKVEKTLEYVDHIRRIFEMWERIPFALLQKITSFFTK